MSRHIQETTHHFYEFLLLFSPMEICTILGLKRDHMRLAEPFGGKRLGAVLTVDVISYHTYLMVITKYARSSKRAYKSVLI